MVFLGDISIVFMGVINQFITFGGHHLVQIIPSGPRAATRETTAARYASDFARQLARDLDEEVTEGTGWGPQT